MSIFNANEVNNQQLDWTIMRDGGIGLYWRPEILANDLQWLESQGYRIISFDAGNWQSEDQMHASFKASLAFPDYYGMNMDALNDCVQEDLYIPEQGGLVLILNHYDRFAKIVTWNGAAENTFASIVLGTFARAIRHHMLFGRRLMILVQTDDPQIRFDNLAPVHADWNPREWLNKNRGL